MMPTSFPEQNFTFTKPKGMTDEQCMDLHVFRGHDTDGNPVVVSKWQPNKEDLEALNRGEGIYLITQGPYIMPLTLQTESPFVAEKTINQ